MEPPDSIDADVLASRLQEELFQSLVESADYVDERTSLPARSVGTLHLAAPEAIRESFVDAWETLSHSLGLGIRPEVALLGMRDLVLYEIPDGTRSTLSIPLHGDVESDPALFCVSLVHTLASLGARTALVLTHTSYNRARGPEETRRFLRAMMRGIEPFQGYARRHGIAIRIAGLRPGYELDAALLRAFPPPAKPTFEAHFLVDYEEEWFLTAEGRELLASLPEIDVVVRHTKLGLSGGWIPTKMHRTAYVYSQNGTVASNWTFPEFATLAAVSYLAKVLNQGEGLTKTYASIDEVKSRYREREMRLRQSVVRLRPNPKKLFLLGSPVGLVQVYG